MRFTKQLDHSQKNIIRALGIDPTREQELDSLFKQVLRQAESSTLPEAATTTYIIEQAIKGAKNLNEAAYYVYMIAGTQADRSAKMVQELLGALRSQAQPGQDEADPLTRFSEIKN